MTQEATDLAGLTSRSFQGVNSLPLPGAVGRGPEAVTYHVEVANVVAGDSYFMVERLRHRLRRLSVPPKSVVKWVESISTMSPAR